MARIKQQGRPIKVRSLARRVQFKRVRRVVYSWRRIPCILVACKVYVLKHLPNAEPWLARESR